MESDNTYTEPEKKLLMTRVAVLLFMVAMRLVMPTLAIVAAMDGGNAAVSRDLPSPHAALWVAWGVFSFWIIFDTRRFLRILKASVDPLGAEEIALTLAGIANSCACYMFVHRGFLIRVSSIAQKTAATNL